MCGEWINIINKVPMVKDHYVLEADLDKVKEIKIKNRLYELKVQINRYNDINVECKTVKKQIEKHTKNMNIYEKEQLVRQFE